MSCGSQPEALCPTGDNLCLVAEYGKQIAGQPNNIDNYFRRALIYQKVKNLDAAVVDCTKALTIEPKDSRIYKLRGAVYFEQKQFVKAIDDFEKVTKLEPGISENFRLFGEAYQA